VAKRLIEESDRLWKPADTELESEGRDDPGLEEFLAREELRAEGPAPLSRETALLGDLQDEVLARLVEQASLAPQECQIIEALRKGLKQREIADRHCRPIISPWRIPVVAASTYRA
jgi:hypothetical protein